MIWQDAAITAVCFLFGFFLIPSLMSPGKPPRLTCLLMGSGVAVLAAVFATLSMWLSVASEVFVASMWFALMLQRRPG